MGITEEVLYISIVHPWLTFLRGYFVAEVCYLECFRKLFRISYQGASETG